MHRALFIDEILREIFESCSDFSGHVLCQAAQCCRAWKEPALDKLWRDLSSIKPILDLIPGLKCIDNVYFLNGLEKCPTDLYIFYSYARRVRRITLRHSVRMDPSAQRIFQSISSAVFPCLSVVQLSSAASNDSQASISLMLSSQLKQLDIDLGFKIKGLNDSLYGICDYLEQVCRVARDINQLIIRGRASARLYRSIASMSSLRALYLRTGSSLTADTLADLSTFPSLKELELHADDIQADTLNKLLILRNAPTFPKLQFLRVRAQSSLVEVLLHYLHPDTLRTLHLEFIDLIKAPISWSSLFSLIHVNAANSLQDLAIEHIIDIDDHTDTIDSNSNTPHTITSTSLHNLNPLNFDTLRCLSRIHDLRRFVLDVTIPPNLCDRDIEYLVKWWPNIEHLDLGTNSPFACTEQGLASRMTMGSMCILAKHALGLRSLILPLDLTASFPASAYPESPQNALQRLTIGSTAAPDPMLISPFLLQLFPSLTEIDGTAAYEDHWAEVRAVVCRLNLRVKL